MEDEKKMLETKQITMWLSTEMDKLRLQWIISFCSQRFIQLETHISFCVCLQFGYFQTINYIRTGHTYIGKINQNLAIVNLSKITHTVYPLILEKYWQLQLRIRNNVKLSCLIGYTQFIGLHFPIAD